MDAPTSAADAPPDRGEASGRVEIRETDNAAPAAVQRSGSGLRETDDAYARVVVIDGKHRIIECRDRIQWIIQRREGPRWVAIHFCRWRETLLRLCRSWSDEALAVIRSLPEGIEEAGR